MERFNVGIVGHGVGLRLHYPVLSKIGKVNAFFISLPHVESTSRIPVSETYRIGVSEQVDLLLVGTPPFAHEFHVSIGINSGIAVICEKPVGLSSSCPLSLQSKSLTTKVPVHVGYQLRFYKTVATVKRRIRTFHPVSLEIVYNSSARKNKKAFPHWYNNGQFGGGVKFSILPHIVDLIHFWGFSFESVKIVDISPTNCFQDALDQIELESRLDEMTKLRLTINTLCDFSQFFVRTSDRKGNCLIWDLITGEVHNKLSVPESNPPSSPSTLMSSAHGIWQIAFEEMIRNVFRIRGDAKLNLRSCASLTDAVRVHRVLEAVSESIQKNGGVAFLPPY